MRCVAVLMLMLCGAGIKCNTYGTGSGVNKTLPLILDRLDMYNNNAYPKLRHYLQYGVKRSLTFSGAGEVSTTTIRMLRDITNNQSSHIDLHTHPGSAFDNRETLTFDL